MDELEDVVAMNPASPDLDAVIGSFGVDQPILILGIMFCCVEHIKDCMWNISKTIANLHIKAVMCA